MPQSYENDKFIIHGAEKQFNPNPKGVGFHLFENLMKNQDKIGQIDSETGVKETFGSILERAVKTSIEMLRRGVQDGDIISICAYNHLNTVVPYLATLFLNCKLACLDPSLSVSDTKHLINQVKPKMIFVGPEAEDLIGEVLKSIDFTTEVITFGSGTKYERFINFLKASSEDVQNFLPVPVKDLKDTVIILFSSGTTGMPKGICLHHYGILCQLGDGGNFPVDMTLMTFASPYWIFTLNMICISIRAGAARILVPYFDPKKAWDVIDVFKPNFIFAAPSQYLEMLKNEGVPKNKDTSSIRFLAVGGHKVSSDQMKYIKSQFPKTFFGQGYGLTEATGTLICFNGRNPEDVRLAMKNPDSCGRPISGFSYKVVDLETNKILGLNQSGELRVKSDFVMNGYYNMDSTDAWDKEGWLKTGDVGYFDEDHCFFIVGRVKEMFKYKSWHVVPAKLESVIASHPDVSNVVVVGIPHPEDGDHACAVVTLKKEAIVTSKELLEFANAQLGEREQLRGGLFIVDKLPLTPTGKVKRIEVFRNVVHGLY